MLNITGVCEGPTYRGFEYGTERGAHAPLIRWNMRLDGEDDNENVYVYFNGGGHYLSEEDLADDLFKKRDGDDDPSGCGLSKRGCSAKRYPAHDVSAETQLKSLRPVVRRCASLARYIEKPNRPSAIMKCDVGSGVAILSGVHFEWNVDYMDKSDPYLKDVIPKMEQSHQKQPQWMHSIITHLLVRSQQST